MEKALIEHIKSIPDSVLLINEPMSRHTSFRIGGPAEVYIEAQTKAAMISIYRALADAGITPFVIGNGSNILVSDKGIKGVVLRYGGGECRVSGEYIEADGGVALRQLAQTARDAGLTGLEFAYGIPGSVGGAVCMNAGAYGGEIKGVLEESEYIDNSGQVKKLEKDLHQFGYRESIYKNTKNIVLSARFKLEPGDISEIDAKMKEFIKRRRDKQPLGLPSAGSVFKRPVGYYAGTLIEECGLKGYSVGGAQVSDKHAGFIINRGDATCEDVLKLIESIQNTVRQKSGVELECEIMRV